MAGRNVQSRASPGRSGAAHALWRRHGVPAGSVPGIQPFDDQRIVLGSAEETIGFLAGRRQPDLAAVFPDGNDAARKRYFLAKYETSRI